jgi:hypothetical protein
MRGASDTPRERSEGRGAWFLRAARMRRLVWWSCHLARRRRTGRPVRGACGAVLVGVHYSLAFEGLSPLESAWAPARGDAVWPCRYARLRRSALHSRPLLREHRVSLGTRRKPREHYGESHRCMFRGLLALAHSADVIGGDASEASGAGIGAEQPCKGEIEETGVCCRGRMFVADFALGFAFECAPRADLRRHASVSGHARRCDCGTGITHGTS